jgi:hypothetical protein
LGDERRVRARDPRRPRVIEVTTNCVPSAVSAADLRFGGVVGPSWFLRAAGDFPHDARPANSQGVTLGDVVPAVYCSSCVFVCLG